MTPTASFLYCFMVYIGPCNCISLLDPHHNDRKTKGKLDLPKVCEEYMVEPSLGLQKPSEWLPVL